MAGGYFDKTHFTEEGTKVYSLAEGLVACVLEPEFEGKLLGVF
jgi:hypothetical protein